MVDITHNFLVGTSLNYQKSLFFDLMTSGYVYMGFGRSLTTWGFSSLIKVRQRRTWPDDIMGTGSGTDKYYDLNSGEIGTPPANSDSVYIARILKSAAATIIGNFTFLDIDNIGVMTLEYMNENWARIKGISADYMDYVVSQYPVDEYDYYLFNYNQDIDSRIPIETVEESVLSTIEYPIRLMYTTESGGNYPTTAFGNNLVGNLTRSINTLGETIIQGLRAEFITEGDGYIEENSLQNATFFITNANGVVLQDNLKYVQTYESGSEKSIIFSFPIVGEAIQNSGRLKVSNTINPNTLLAFHEKYSDGTRVSDDNPPPLTTSYLNSGSIHTSVLEVLGLKKITDSEVTFARRIENENTKQYLISAGMVDNVWPTGNVETLTLNSDSDNSVEYFVTNDVEFARQYYFDLVRINITLDSSTPTSEIYRQLFLSYKPYLEDGTTLCTSDTYVHADLFNTDDYSYDLGTMLYLSNKSPVWRSYIEGNEEFTILI